MLGIFLLRCVGVILHSRHLDSFGVTSLQGPSCINGAPVRFRVATESLTSGLLKDDPSSVNT